MRRIRQAWLAAAALLVLGLTGACAGEGPERSAPPDDSEPEPSWTSPDHVAERCLSLTPDGDRATPVTVKSPGISLVAAEVEPSEPSGVGVVLLPQVGPSGLCGWLPFSVVLADDEGVHALAVDPCGTGESECDDDTPVAKQVDAAASWLRESRAVDRVVLMGASAGGSLSVLAVQDGAEVDAWVDVSGPSAWDTRILVDDARGMAGPGLVVQARNDGAASEYPAARRLARLVGARFVSARQGHGWELLTTRAGRVTGLGGQVARFVGSAAR